MKNLKAILQPHGKSSKQSKWQENMEANLTTPAETSSDVQLPDETTSNYYGLLNRQGFACNACMQCEQCMLKLHVRKVGNKDCPLQGGLNPIRATARRDIKAILTAC